MADVNLFLRKRSQKGKQRVASRTAPPPPFRNGSAPQPVLSQPSLAAPSPRPVASSSASSSSHRRVKGEVFEFKLWSSGPTSGQRYNLMKMNSSRDVDLSIITPPVLLNRKQPGPKAPPQYAFDESGKLIGRFLYDDKGVPIVDAEGNPMIERKAEMDMSLVGGAPGEASAKRRNFRKGTKEVFHQDIDVIRLRREEANPWVLESGNPAEKPVQPEHWVGRMVEPSSLPTVLFVSHNDGNESGFRVLPLGRTYRFEPDRPFKVLDSDAAHKLYEQQAKYKVQDRWGLRPDDSAGSSSNPIALPSGGAVVGSNSLPSVKVEIKQEQRAMRMEQRIQARKGVRQTAGKVERFDDDSRAEKRNLGRGMEGEADEELDYDVNDDFQDDEENNTFYRDENEEEEAKLLEDRLKKEFRLANVNVGDKPQIEDVEPDDGDDDDDLFGDPKLNREGKKLRKMMRKRREQEGSDDSLSSDSDESDSDSDVSKNEKKPSENTSDSKDPKSAPGSAERPSRPPSRGPSGRGTSSPTGRRPNPPTPGKASTAPPGSGAALLAQRAASRGASPLRSRAGSPLNPRAASPDAPAPGSSGGRSGSPALGRASSPATREASPAPLPPSTSAGSGKPPVNRPKSGKRKTTSESPLRDPINATVTPASGSSAPGLAMNSPNKRKTLEASPTPSAAGSVDGGAGGGGGTNQQKRKKKKSSSTTPTPGPGTPSTAGIEPFEGMITEREIVDWFNDQGKAVPMASAIAAFRDRILSAGPRRQDNQNLFLALVKAVTDSKDRMLTMKEEYVRRR